VGRAPGWEPGWRRLPTRRPRLWRAPGEQLNGQLDEAGRRLREVGYYIDIAQRLGYLPLGSAVELLERQTLAGVEVNALFEDEGGVRFPNGGDPESTADLAAEVLATLSASSR
jgi:hypothetical protein